MHFSTALITLALALTSSVSAAASDTQSVTSTYATANVNQTGTTITDQTINVATQHSVFGYVKYLGNTASVGYNAFVTINGTAQAQNTVSTANAQVNQFAVDGLQCPVCNPSVVVGSGYTYSYAVTANSATSQTVTFNATTIADTNVLLANGTALTLNVPALDDQKQQPGKLLYFTIPVNAQVVGNRVSGNLTFASTENIVPFSSVNIVGGGLCPKPVANDNIVRQTLDLTNLTNLATVMQIPNLAVGTYWVYLAPKAATLNTLTSATTATLALSPVQASVCVPGTNGFCASSAATLKSAVGVAFAGAMAAAFFLF